MLLVSSCRLRTWDPSESGWTHGDVLWDDNRWYLSYFCHLFPEDFLRIVCSWRTFFFEQLLFGDIFLRVASSILSRGICLSFFQSCKWFQKIQHGVLQFFFPLKIFLGFRRIDGWYEFQFSILHPFLPSDNLCDFPCFCQSVFVSASRLAFHVQNCVIRCDNVSKLSAKCVPVDALCWLAQHLARVDFVTLHTVTFEILRGMS